MFLVRDVARRDLPSLKRLAAVLNSVNLPNDEKVLTGLIETSVRSFSARIENPFEREYLFVLEDVRTGQVIGTSMIIAQHGTREAPHISFQVSTAEHYSATVDSHFRHTVLSIGYNYEGPTEIGGLVVDPPHRSSPAKPGKQLSYVRFAFMAMHRELFRERVLAELLPPLMPNGRSFLWEACGKKFTGLDYTDADRLSRANKEFIKELFPSAPIYASLFSERVQKTIGVVGPQTRGVQRMLERIGFTYVNRIDPFDGGPHYEATLADTTLVRAFRSATVAKASLDHDAEELLVSVVRPGGPNRFRAVRTMARFDDRQLLLPSATRALLKVKAGDTVGVIPLDEPPPGQRAR
ncbi:MAG: arginine N-succinyltransferase [Archangium sp.]|nr:arginine N-succinyltransferase [Archangium sp.]